MIEQRRYKKHIPRKRFGQNFLHDPFVIDDIIEAINPKNNQALIEIGPGLGALTKPILQKVEQLTAIEIDWDLANQLAAEPSLKNKLTVIQDDVMNIDFAQLANRIQKPLRIFGNLPYNISTALIFHLFNFITAIADMYFMLQQEVVDRLTAQPNNKTYGRLSVMTQYFCDIVPLLSVPSTAFIPPPKVHSSFVQLIPHHLPTHPVKDITILSLITKHAFNQRRKTISNSLSSLFTTAQFKQLNIDETMRAENLSVVQYVKLANLYYFENRYQ